MKVLIVGAGPAGSTAAYYLASAGVDVTVLEKTAFPREKVCGDGLTPRAVREIQFLGLPHEEAEGWRRNKGLRLIAGGRTLELPWPVLSDFPDYGLIRTRLGFDEALARHAQAAGAKILERHTVVSAIRADDGRVEGAVANVLDENGRRTGERREFFADVVLAADGNSSRTALSLGIEKRDDRPMGVAVRTYFESPRTNDEWMEGWLELPDAAGNPLPGYGWVFGVGDGTSNVGLGILNSSKEFGKLDYRKVLRDWTAGMPAEWGFTPENQVGEIRGAALPMGFNRTPHYSPGLLLLGDAGGMVSPFNGEGISYAMESARFAAEHIIEGEGAALTPGLLTSRAAFDGELRGYAGHVREEWGSHFTLGRIFASMIGRPAIMKLALRTGMPIPVLMRFVVRMLANLTDRSSKGIEDRVIALLEMLVPAASNQGTPGTSRQSAQLP
ncbi:MULTISPECIES: geranylgeranyl reductase family protein [unclassified Arthrobacter]|uniref:geranylgeranyl reductase family protein n=1 Tax=unclassified Arthrobacter TaxID=235627 RepID=UPI0024E03741|nr:MULTISPECIES: geranylgeranyl reductase family protein [unclassified Arthrobacter]MCC9144793.1 geranylgeranyl reductase family protein [Arthrobacter sp. zg-Y919]MDK1276019.1 geranylgeranyl reductase family protein [Arthrobacter sp. zg.Y919]MDM7990117.1 geranylgeranyl reductase family protein [Arthrobacter sp. zg-Y877]WIB02633.1 geranylgeranyl reductase family protein [Arthrobacter sp. zg-Y919]